MDFVSEGYQGQRTRELWQLGSRVWFVTDSWDLDDRE
jgi:hypothetical protein